MVALSNGSAGESGVRSVSAALALRGEPAVGGTKLGVALGANFEDPYSFKRGSARLAGGLRSEQHTQRPAFGGGWRCDLGE